MFSISFYKMTGIKLKRRDIIRYQSVNSSYCSCDGIYNAVIFPCFPYSYKNTSFSQSKLTFSKCYCILFTKQKTFSVFRYSFRNTSESLGEREIEVGTRACKASVFTLFRVLPNFHACFYYAREHREFISPFIK